MKTKSVYMLFLLMVPLLLVGCSGGGGSGTDGVGYGTITMDITDAKPFIEGNQPDELWIVIEEVLIHKPGEGWISLNLIDTPVEINLLAFSDGLSTKLVPPMQITTGHITQIRMVISRAYMVFNDPYKITEIYVPSGKLRTDKECDWWSEDAEYGDALSITIHFDLSQSIVQTGENEFKIKPVFHLFNNNLEEAGTICGTIDGESFGDPPEDVLVTVIWHGPEGDEIYTRVLVPKNMDTADTDFCIYWLVPPAVTEGFTEGYTVQVTYDNKTYDIESIEPAEFGPGDTYSISEAIVIPPPV